MTRALHAAARYGRFILVLGLLAGALLPEIAQAMKPWLPTMVGALLYLAALRIGLKQVLGGLADQAVAFVGKSDNRCRQS